MRPNTLNVSRDKTDNDTNKFIREALHAWRAKARCNIVPAERLRDLFEELHFSPTEKQINEMLQTAKMFARRGSSLEPNVSGNSKRVNGLTFGEFCVLAADLKRFRTTQQQHQQLLHQQHPPPHQQPPHHHNNDGLAADDATATASSSASPAASSSSNGDNGSAAKPPRTTTSTIPEDNALAASLPNGSASAAIATAPEVFLGGSCNPTTWRADVAIPALDKLGISFYNPQVSDWTPDLIELEHRAKEKARVLFFVMDSETRASAGAIEAAHIAGQNARHLVVVLHPYQANQCILNEPISAQEFLDLKRNQRLLRELVTRRGLPVLDNIPSGLQRTRAILAGTSERPTPHNIAFRLISVSRAFDLVANAAAQSGSSLSGTGRITIAQCQGALQTLGYAHNLLSIDNLCHILRTHREAVAALENVQPASATRSDASTVLSFDEFCMLTSYLTVLQQEIHENGCVSPIKGTNLPQPPIYLTNQLDFTHSQHEQDQHEQPQQPSSRTSLQGLYSSQIFRTSSCKSVPEDQRHGGAADLYEQQQRQLRTSSDQPMDVVVDPNDSVFPLNDADAVVLRTHSPVASGPATRDVYLGGSCPLRTKWRSELAVPLLEQRSITYHLPVAQEHSAGICKNGAIAGRSDAVGEQQIYDPAVLDACHVLLFVVTNETRSLAPMTLAAHYIGLGYNVVLCVQMLPEFCIIGSERLTAAAIKDYNRGRAYLIDLAKRQGVPVFTELRAALDCTVEKVQKNNSRNSI